MSHVKNNEVANILFEIADLLELKYVRFKPRAYRRAAQNVNSLAEDIDEYYQKKKLNEIPGIGKSIASKIEEILETGKLKYLQDLKKEFPDGIEELMQIQGLGPRKIMQLYQELHISNLEDLENAVKEGKVKDLKGFGEKSEKKILQGIEMYKEAQKRFLLGEILPISREIMDKLKSLKDVQKIEVAGSIRRKKETIGDIDILVISENPDNVMDAFTSLSEIKRIVSKGKSRSTIIIENNLQIDLRIVEEGSFGSALQYFTGSKEHNIQLRKIALEKDWKLSEYGLRDKEKNKKIAGDDEAKIYELLGLAYVVPELREDRGEIEAALKNELPNLIELSDIK